jgi:hypothetical protein
VRLVKESLLHNIFAKGKGNQSSLKMDIHSQRDLKSGVLEDDGSAAGSENAYWVKYSRARTSYRGRATELTKHNAESKKW